MRGAARKSSKVTEQKESPGNDLLSHTVASAVPWALEGLTARFGMELGVSPPLASPEDNYSRNTSLQGFSPAKD